jgi:Holliday junction resolvase
MDFTPLLETKGFFRFTGPPEHWLYAVKYMTWGLEEKHKAHWQRIQPGDIFFIHSTRHSYFSNAKSGIIGLGVIGSDFNIKKDFRWLRELKEGHNIWPLLVPFSEMYLFSELPPIQSWDAPNLTNETKTKTLVDALLKNYIPLSNIIGFPQMGSVSGVSKAVASQILFDKRPLYAHESELEDLLATAKPTKLTKVDNVAETFRYAATLRSFNNIEPRLVKEAASVYTKDNELLAKADRVHSSIIQRLIEIFKAKGYYTLSYRFVDLFAHNGKRSLLFEVKSTENRNFRSQARKGVIQLLEYDYFEIRKFEEEQNLSFKNKSRILVPSRLPEDEKYIGFINELNIGVALANEKRINAVGADLGISSI